MKLKQLKNEVDALCRNPKNLNKKVKLMLVEDGMTFASDIHSVSEMEPYDGEGIWIIPAAEIEAPKWSKSEN